MPFRTAPLVVLLPALLSGVAFTSSPTLADDTRAWAVETRMECELPEPCADFGLGFRLETADGDELARTMTGPGRAAATEWSTDPDENTPVFLIPMLRTCDGDIIEEAAIEIAPVPDTHQPRLQLMAADDPAAGCRVLAVRLSYIINANDRLRVFATINGELAFENSGTDTVRRCDPAVWVSTAEGRDWKRARRLEAFVWPDHRPEIAPDETLMFPRAPAAPEAVPGSASVTGRRVELSVETAGWIRVYGTDDEERPAPPACDLLLVPWPLPQADEPGGRETAVDRPESDRR